jgi:hypothetical protein
MQKKHRQSEEKPELTRQEITLHIMRELDACNEMPHNSKKSDAFRKLWKLKQDIDAGQHHDVYVEKVKTYKRRAAILPATRRVYEGVDSSTKLTEEVWSKHHKICKIHGIKYPLIADFFHPSQTGMCGHPNCLQALTMHLGKQHAIVKLALKMDKEGAFWEDVVDHLLSTISCNRPTVVHPMAARFISLNFIHKVNTAANRNRLRDSISNTLEQLSNEEVDDIYFTAIHSMSSENYVFFKQVEAVVREEYGAVVSLWLMGLLNDRDVSLYKNIKVRSLAAYKEEIAKRVKSKLNGDMHLKYDSNLLEG